MNTDSMSRIPVLALACVALLAAASTPAMAGDDAESPVLIYLPDNRADTEHMAIIQALGDAGFDVRTYAYAGEDAVTYARRIAGDVHTLMATGTDPSQITVLGSGMGSTVAQLTSAAVGSRQVNYVLLGQCDRFLKDKARFRMAGRILGLRDDADSDSDSCRPLWQDAPKVSARRDTVLHTGLGAALFAHPHDMWMKPAVEWGMRGRVKVGDVQVSQR